MVQNKITFFLFEQPDRKIKYKFNPKNININFLNIYMKIFLNKYYKLK